MILCMFSWQSEALMLGSQAIHRIRQMLFLNTFKNAFKERNHILHYHNKNVQWI